ncbi:MAG: hypothetical protein V1718_05210 [archaeon]
MNLLTALFPPKTLKCKQELLNYCTGKADLRLGISDEKQQYTVNGSIIRYDGRIVTNQEIWEIGHDEIWYFELLDKRDVKVDKSRSLLIGDYIKVDKLVLGESLNKIFDRSRLYLGTNYGSVFTKDSEIRHHDKKITLFEPSNKMCLTVESEDSIFIKNLDDFYKYLLSYLKTT